MTAQELLNKFFTERQSGWIDLEHQKRIAEQLVMKYTDEQLEKALEMYGNKMYSLAFLSPKNMGRVILQKQNEIKVDYEVGGDIAKRNKEKLQGNSSIPRWGAWHFDDLFE